jgi:hypothetical protein
LVPRFGHRIERILASAHCSVGIVCDGFFVPGPAARRLAGDDAQYFVYLWVVLTFP